MAQAPQRSNSQPASRPSSQVSEARVGAPSTASGECSLMAERVYPASAASCGWRAASASPRRARLSSMRAAALWRSRLDSVASASRAISVASPNRSHHWDGTAVSAKAGSPATTAARERSAASGDARAGPERRAR
ncbi:hypothetical protein [Ralstonia pseudosolanacearum]|uniref:hypothetical protein n=1 Tax=Ralstonia pseudosolanacearum TaxID=1310165 RepID=UPI001F29286D|nr:hypothetical protein [Ralstonia pseudosolanacearum]